MCACAKNMSLGPHNCTGTHDSKHGNTTNHLCSGCPSRPHSSQGTLGVQQVVQCAHMPILYCCGSSAAPAITAVTMRTQQTIIAVAISAGRTVSQGAYAGMQEQHALLTTLHCWGPTAAPAITAVITKQTVWYSCSGYPSRPHSCQGAGRMQEVVQRLSCLSTPHQLLQALNIKRGQLC